MTEHGILFTPENYDKVASGVKVQTRRIVKPQPSGKHEGVYADLYNKGPEWAFWLPDNRMTEPRTWKCPFGTVGDRLYVKEGLEKRMGHNIQYRRDKKHLSPYGWQWQRPTLSPLHMPKWAARLWLEITEVRVERLQDCSSDDAIAEGANDFEGECPLRDKRLTKSQLQYAALWESINGPGSWDLNSWVWVLSFRKVQP